MSTNKNISKRSGIILLFAFLVMILLINSPATSEIIEKIPETKINIQTQIAQTPIVDGSLTFETEYDMIASYGWETPEAIKDPVYMNDLKIAIDNEDNAHILWSGRDGENWFLYHIMKFNNNNSWSQIQNIGTTTTSFKGLLDVESDENGNIHVVWQDDSFIKYKYYDHGQWSEVYVIDVGFQPHIEINMDNKPKIVYSKYYNYRTGYFCVTKKTISAWEYQQIPTVLTSYYYDIIESNYDFLLTIEEDLERLYFMTGAVVQVGPWNDRSFVLEYNLVWKENQSVPFTWSGYDSEYELPQTFHYLAKPMMVEREDGEVYFIHQVIEDVDDFSLAYQKRNSTGYWSETETLTDKVGLLCQMTGAVDSFDRIVLMWNHKIDEIFQPTVAGIYLKFFSPKTQDWTNDMLINPDHGYSQYPNLALDSVGNIHLAWLDQKDENRTLYYRKGWVDTDEDGLIDKEEEEVYFTNPYNEDTDDDDLIDGDEIANGLDPLEQDSDSDGMFDGYEFHNELNPYVNDSTLDFDNDLLINIDEFVLGTLPNNNDTDSDSLNDYDEVTIYFTNPKHRDSDSDDLDDAYELTVTFSNPNDWDTDNDTMNDWYEDIYGIAKGSVLDILVNDSMEDPDTDGLINMLECQLRTNPNLTDTDYDGLLDGEEVLIYFTHPINKDTDLDGLEDGEEVNGYLYSANPWGDPMGYFYTDPLVKDTDADSVNDLIEITNMMNPVDNDTDDDLMIDGYEFIYRNNPGLNASDSSDALIDFDQDGLTNLEESYLWTHPNNTDTDFDRLLDSEEITLGSDPTKWDTDFDGLNDYNELIILGTNVTNPDTDSDGLNDYFEVLVYYSNPLITDTDEDTLSDGDEVYIYGTNPISVDSDKDLIEDNIELIFGSDPTLYDTDFDGMDDYFEFIYGLNPIFDDSELDAEGDGVANGEEHQYNSNPLIPDTDFDGLTDYEEIVLYFTRPDHVDTDLDQISDFDEINTYFTSPHDPDSDDDRIIDGIEISIGTDPLKLDTDGDGISDGQELEDQTNPLDASDNRKSIRTRLVLISFSSIIGFMLVYYLTPLLFSKARRDTEIIWVHEGINKRKQKSEKILNHKETSIEKND
ncbi:MAG: exo-alpha-sialidase [Asgard group archaeon]|nr:exo-alpha-sialidase [Asgard group archaeon]